MSISEEDSQIRKEWQTNSRVQIYSNSKRKWFVGEVAQIFHDAEGEWLEIRYDKSMSKQVQRFSTDIKPTEEQMQEMRQRIAKEKMDQKKASPKKEVEQDIVEATRDLRVLWKKGDKVQIFSNTHQEWYTAEVMDIVKDDEGEWLNVVWHRENGEAMSKQVQRFSTDVRPVPTKQKPAAIATTTTTTTTTVQVQNEKSAQNKSNSQSLEEEIKQRKQGYKRRAPPFARTCTGIIWQYPATQGFRRAKKLDNVEEGEEEEDEATASNIEKWSNEQVCEWLKNMGSAYEKYVPKFRTIRGNKLKCMSEDDFIGLGLPKLHAVKLSFEIQKSIDKSIAKETLGMDVLGWGSSDVAKWAQKHPPVNQYASKFESHGIDGVILFELTSDDLNTIGIRPFHREKILEIINEFSKQVFPDLIPIDEKGTNNSNNDNNNDNDSDTNTNHTINHGSGSNGITKIEINGDSKECNGDNSNNNNNNNSNNEKKESEINHLLKNKNEMHHKRRQSVQLSDESTDIQLLKDMRDLLNIIPEELSTEKLKNQAHLVQEKVNALLDQIDGNWSDIVIEDDDDDVIEQKSSNTVQASPLTPSGRASPFGEAEGKPIAGIPLSYVNSLEQKRGHRRRQSIGQVPEDFEKGNGETTDVN